MEEDETQGEILCFLDSGTFFMESNQESRRWSSVFDVKKTLQSGWEIFCLCWIENCSAVGKLQPIQANSDIEPSAFPHPLTLLLFLLGREIANHLKKKNSFPLGIVENVFIRVFSKEKKKNKTDDVKLNSSAFGARDVLLWV